MSNLVTISYDSEGRVGTITQSDLTTEEFSADQEQGWTNSGTSGSPAPATLLAAAGSTFTDANSNVTTIRPDWWGLGTTGQLTDALGDTDTFDYNSNGLPTIVVDNLNRITQFTYNSQGNVTEEIYPDATDETLTYNSDSEVLTDENADGNTTTFTYLCSWQPQSSTFLRGGLGGLPDPTASAGVRRLKRAASPTPMRE